MPFYEYQCRACGVHHEAMQKISDPPLKKCPECGRSQLQKLVSAPVFRLKGGGWYETDFKSDKETKRNLAGEDKAGGGADPKAESTTETKADVKPDAKPDAKPVAKPAVDKAPRKAPAKAAKPARAAKPAPRKVARRR